jgi:hypothetical protein
MYYLFIYSSLSDAISNFNWKITFHIYDTVSMGYWFLTFQGNTVISSSRANLEILTTKEDDTTTLSTRLRKPENLHEYTSLNDCMEVSKELEMI